MTQTPSPRPAGRAGRPHMNATIAWILGVVVGGVLGVAVGYAVSSIIVGVIVGIMIAVGFGFLFSPSNGRPRKR